MPWRSIKGRVAVKETKEFAYTVLNVKPVQKQQHPVALCYLLINVQDLLLNHLFHIMVSIVHYVMRYILFNAESLYQ